MNEINHESFDEADEVISSDEATSSDNIRILAVDDDRTSLMMLETLLLEYGHEVVCAKNGSEAWEILQKEKSSIDILLIDREMPVMNGMEVVNLLKKDLDLKHIPVIMQTGNDEPEQVKEGIDAGVFYYMAKPINDVVLTSVLSSAIREVSQQKVLSSELSQHKNSFNLIEHCEFKFNKLSDAESLACFVANSYPDVDKVLLGLAELLINAHEHGNLEIGYEEKTKLIDQETWREEIIRRERLPENQDKYVTATFVRKEDGFYFTIKDQGEGFEWKKYLVFDPSRAQDNHGRGIAQANTLSFDKITYNDVGNEVTTFTSNEPDLEW